MLTIKMISMAFPVRHCGAVGLITGFICIHLFLLWMEAASCNAQVDGPVLDSSIRSIHPPRAVPTDTRTDSIEVDTALYNRLLLHIAVTAQRSPGSRLNVHAGQ
jgi:hypothetical protein